MKKYLLPYKGNFYKANMHMHSTLSDGKMTPEEIKRVYMEAGYSIVAYTDHEILVPHTKLSDENFLAITATELAFNSPQGDSGYPYVQTYHLNFYSKDPEKSVISVWDPDYVFEQSKPFIPEEQKSVTYKRTYGVDAVNAAIAKANADGFFVSYNHPVWSLQNYGDYGGLKGLWGVECFNHSCLRVGFFENETAYNDLLTEGENVFPLATDDAHGLGDCFGGFIMVKAENLQYDTVVNALEKGDFYASEGPEIYELYVEDGFLCIKCSPVKEVRGNVECRMTFYCADEKGAFTSGKWELRPYLQLKKTPEWRKPFLRITLTDAQGRKAYTRAFRLEELQ